VHVESLWRYPVKSMLGEQLHHAEVTAPGLVGDRAVALVDERTGAIASAKQPRLWRSLLSVTAEQVAGTVRVHLPGQPPLSLDDPEADARLSAFLGRPVRVSRTPWRCAGHRPGRPGGGARARRRGRGQLARARARRGGAGAELPGLRPAAPDHDRHPRARRVPAARYRPNLVLRTPPGAAPYAEHGWVGSTLTIGRGRAARHRSDAPLRVPVLAHGDLPPDAHARSGC
jgi:hypothetical protein